MKVYLTNEQWLQRGRPTIGDKYYLWIKGKKVWYDIVVQDWGTRKKPGIGLSLSKVKSKPNP